MRKLLDLLIWAMVVAAGTAIILAAFTRNDSMFWP